MKANFFISSDIRNLVKTGKVCPLCYRGNEVEFERGNDDPQKRRSCDNDECTYYEAAGVD